MLTPDDEAKIHRIVTEAVTKAINHAFDTHPRLARMEKRDGRMQRDINYIVEAIDNVDRNQRVTAKDLYLRTKRIEGTA